jgi:nickel-type superoxide dismutase maturation protease
MIKFIKVTGDSLSPAYKEGDYVMLVTVPFFSFKRGDTIVFRQPQYGTMIKNIDSIDSDKIFVVGTHPRSTDSRQFGPIQRGDVVGKVIWHIKKP